MNSSLSQRRRQHLVLLWSLALASTSALASTASSIPRKRFRDSMIKFPSVHSVTVDKQVLQTPQYSQRIAEMDVMRIRCPDEQCRIQAMIHSQRSLEHFRGHNIPFEFDADADAKEAFTPRKLESDTSQVNTDPYSRINGFDCYLDYQGTMDWLQDLVNNQNYSHVEFQLLDIGDSYLKTKNSDQGYDIIALKVSSPAPVVKSPMLIQTGIHPREYSPPELVRQWVSSFLDPKNLEIQTILYSTDIYWVPYVNPDGRVLAETTQTMRRKNANNEAAGSEYCSQSKDGVAEYGVDLNRNYPFRWGRLDGSSDDPCQQTFHGSGPASEPEIQAIIQFGLSIFPEAQRLDSNNFYLDNPVGYDKTNTTGIFLDIHSWGDEYIYPWGFQNVTTPNHDSLTAIANKLAHFTGFPVCGPGPCYTATASGASDDWSYSTLGAAGMTWEIGTSFHQDCWTFETDILPRNIAALTYHAKLARLPHMMSLGPDVNNVIPSTTLLAYNETLTISFEASDTVYLDGKYYSTPAKLDSMLIYIDEHPYGTQSVSELVQPHWVLKKGELNVTNDGKLSVAWDWQILVGRWSLTSRPVEGDHVFYFIGVDSRGYRGPVAAIAVAVAALPTASPTVAANIAPSFSPSAMPAATDSFLAISDSPAPSANPAPTTKPCSRTNSSSSSSCGNMTQVITDSSHSPTTRSDNEQVPEAIMTSEQMTENSSSDRAVPSTIDAIMFCIGVTWIVFG